MEHLRLALRAAGGELADVVQMFRFVKDLDRNQITDYLTRVVQPKLSTINGVQQAEILGARVFAMRIWLKSDRMAALAVTFCRDRACIYYAQIRRLIFPRIAISCAHEPFANQFRFVLVDLAAERMGFERRGHNVRR